jgi:hypothetical protein
MRAASVPIEFTPAGTLGSDFVDGSSSRRNLAGDARRPAAIFFDDAGTFRRADLRGYSCTFF